MKNLGYINAEGGPLIIMSSDIAPYWTGAQDEGKDYYRACEFFDKNGEAEGAPINVHNGSALLWEMGGPGTANAFLDDQNNLIVIRTWLNEDYLEADISHFAYLEKNNPIGLGEIELTSDVCVVMWATEKIDSKKIGGFEKDKKAPTTYSLPISDDHLGIVLSLKKGTYTCFHDFVESPWGQARRCHIIKK